ncbi:hypothetical protein RM572_00250 [Streptomyces sp. DSM 42041]|uniref:HNH endonuclease n=1 Tax=Streptomyces hazeniae TaxID=3075538 RepID=A0ABU2NMD0_9ACTN|nr:hypothetical protein [Streptomyces sp. DSM 42041]MDT0377207.1 hypothetical protein [Streptomyces sp. DSM 42041]
MSDLPQDEPRLRTLERYLLVQLAAVRQAIQQIQDGPPRGHTDTTPRWCIQWRFAPQGQPRRGIVHRADCWMADGEKLNGAQVNHERSKPGRSLEPCDQCRPEAPRADSA